MDPREVIVVEESPPSSPGPEKIFNNNSNDIDLSSTNETLSWSTFTAKFISSTMNSVVLDSDNFATDNRCNTMNVTTFNNECAMSNNDRAKNNFPRQYRSPFSQYKPASSQYYQNYMRSIEVTNSYSYYTNNRKTDSIYYLDGPSQTPMKIVNFDRDMPVLEEYPNVTISAASADKESTAQVLQPEFVDVNAYANYSRNISVVRYDSSNQPSLFQTVKQRKTMNSTNPFLNENRTVTVTKMINGEPTTNVISSIKRVSHNVTEDSDDSDIIFVGEYKKEAKVPDVVISNSAKALGNNLNNCEVKLERICPLKITEQETTKSLPAPRRNPKRLVQCLKKSVIAANELSGISKNKLRAKKVNKTCNKNTTCEKNLRRSLRTKLNCGAVYCPPSPITIKHYREWPVEGMHERPEYNPVTNKIEPFDSHIRNISGKNQSTTKANADSCSSSDNDDTLAQLCHEMLHHVLAYVATVKVMQYQEDEEEVLRVTDTKMEFLTTLALEKSANFDDRVWDVLKDTVQNINQPPTVTDSRLSELRELIENSILLYCFTNNVSRSNVSKYIASMNPTDIIQLSNEKFELSH
ncbi:hypothetical protein CBL_06679 [Carabus blaptoides fortunei]